MRIVILIAGLVLIAGFAVAIFRDTRQQICTGTWNKAHTVLTIGHCRTEW
jgi:hypothetical protein